MSDFRSAWFFLAGRKNASILLIPSFFAERVLTENGAPEVPHLQNVANTDVLCGYPSHDSRVIGWRTTQMDVVIGRAPAARRHIDPAFQSVRAGCRTARFEVERVVLLNKL